MDGIFSVSISCKMAFILFEKTDGELVKIKWLVAYELPELVYYTFCPSVTTDFASDFETA